MFVVNRSVAIIKPKQAFLAWANSVSGADRQFSIHDLKLESNVVLIPEYDSEEHAENILKKLFGDIFEIELSGWIDDKSKWPADRTYEKFLQWFEVEIHSMVFDLSPKGIKKEVYTY